MKSFSRITRTFIFGLLFCLIPTVAQTKAKIHQGLPITTHSQQAYDYFIIGQKLLDQGDFIAAHKIFKKALDHDPSFSAGWLGFANTASSAKEFQQGLDRAGMNIKNSSDAEKVQFEIAKTYLNSDLENRVKLSKQLVDNYPNSPRAWLINGDALGNMNHQNEQRKSYTKSIHLDESFTPAYTQMGFSYIFNRPVDFVKGESFMLKASRLDPASESAHVNLGDAHRAIQSLGKASNDYETASLINPNSAVAFVKKGHVDSFLGDFESAKKAYQQALKVSDDISRPYYANYETFIDIHASRPQKAIDNLNVVITDIDKMDLADHQKNSAKLFALTNQVTIALHHSLVDQAKTILGKRESLVRKISASLNDKDFTRNQDADIAFWKGQLAVRMGDFKTAHQYADENSKLVKDNNSPRKMERYHELEGLISLLSEKFDTAKLHYSKADKNSVYVKYHLALVTELSGDKKNAKRMFKEVAQYNFNSVEFALVRKDAISRSDI